MNDRSVRRGRRTAHLAGTLLLATISVAACGEGPTPPDLVEGTTAPRPATTPSAPTTGTLRIVVSGLAVNASAGGTAYVGPCTATACPAIPWTAMRPVTLSAGGVTDIVVAPGAWAVKFEVPTGYDWGWPETGSWTAAAVEAGQSLSLRFYIAPIG